ncbi:MAG: GGDEF domain-containing protein [Dehalococcoidia bacterium]
MSGSRLVDTAGPSHAGRMGTRDVLWENGTAGESEARLAKLALSLQKKICRLEGELVLLRDQLSRDPMTGLRNRRYLEERLDEEAARAARYGHPCSVMVLDVDDLKGINDRWGHAAGDWVLHQVSMTMHATMRAPDVAARLGGDEFAVLLPETDETGGKYAAERLLRNLSLGPTGVYGPMVGIPFSLSIGIAASPQDEDHGQNLLAMADLMMYKAKGWNGNRIEVAWHGPARGRPSRGDLLVAGQLAASPHRPVPGRVVYRQAV